MCETLYSSIEMSPINAKTKAASESWSSAHFRQLHQEHEVIS